MEDARIDIPLLEGEYNPPWAIQARAQMLFLDVVARITPSPLYSLRDKILPRYRAAFKFEETRRRPDVEISRLASGAVADLLYSRALTSLKLPKEVQEAMKAHRLLYDAGAALIAWGEEFNLRGKQCPNLSDRVGGLESSLQHSCWPIVAALQTMLFWHYHPLGSMWERRSPPGWCPPVLTLKQTVPEPEVLPPIELRISVPDPVTKDSRETDAPGWYMGFETEPQFRQRMTEAFDHWMNGYIAGRIESARAAGLEQTPGKQKLPLHFSWAARYQIDKISYAKLAREYRVTDDAVKAGINGALALIGLERRPPQRGGTKTTRR